MGAEFDDVEAHHFIFSNCKELGCTDEDYDITISNLYMRKKLLNKEFQSFLATQLNIITDGKRRLALSRAIKKWKKVEIKSEIEKLLKFDNIQGLLNFISTKKVNLYRISSSSYFGLKILKDSTIPEDIYNKIPIFPKKLDALIGVKIRNGKALGKYVCNSGNSFIIVNKITTKGTLIHEYLHHLQVQNNSDYCDVDVKQVKLLKRFNGGTVSRRGYEGDVLYYQALNNLAEYQVYESLIEYKKFINKFLHLNNKENYSKFKKLVSY